MKIRVSEVTSIALTALAVVSGFYVLVVDRDAPTTKEQSARAGMLVRVWRAEDVSRINIQRRDGQKTEKIELLKEGDRWIMTSPRQAHAEFLAITSVLNALGGARSERAVGQITASERAQFGLDAPLVSIEVAMKGIQLKFSLGGSATQTSGPSSEQKSPGRYLEVAPYGDEKGGVYVVAEEVAAALSRPSDAYREPSLLAANQSPNFKEIRIRSSQGNVRFHRSNFASWRIAKEPDGPSNSLAPIRANIDQMNGLFAAFVGLKADPFVDDSLLVNKDSQLDIDVKDGRTLSLRFGGECPVDKKLILAQLETPKITGCIAPSIVERIQKTAEHYVDKQLFALSYGTENTKISELEHFKFERDGKVILEAERRYDGLHVRVPNDEQVDKESTERFLKRMIAITGTPLAHTTEALGLDEQMPKKQWLSSLGLQPPKVRVTVRRRVDSLMTGSSKKDAGPTNDLWIQMIDIGHVIHPDTKKDKGAAPYVIAHRHDDGALLRLNVADADAFGASAVKDLRNPLLLETSVDSLSEVRVLLSNGLSFAVGKSASVFSLKEPQLGASIGADPTLANDLFKQLSSLTCLRWLETTDETMFQNASKFSIEAFGKRESDAAVLPIKVLEFGDQASDGGVFARVKGAPFVCVLPEFKVEQLTQMPVSRTSLALEQLDTNRLRLQFGKSDLQLMLGDDRAWRSAPESRTQLQALAARKIADSTFAFRAESLFRLGTELESEGTQNPVLTLESYEGKVLKKRIRVGNLTKIRRMPVYYARLDGVSATWLIAREDVDRILAGGTTF